MIFTKSLPVVICLFTVTAAGAQTRQQQQIVGRILADQNRWQQSKLPTRTYYNKNYYYKVPMFPETHLPDSRLSHYEIMTVPKAERTPLSYHVKYPQNSPVYKQDSVYRNKSFVKFNSHLKGS
jgi:hypothetical protein